MMENSVKASPPWLSSSSTTLFSTTVQPSGLLCSKLETLPQSWGYHTPQLPNALLHQHHCVMIKMLELALE